MYKDVTQPITLRVKDLLSRMTVEEKAGQLNLINGGTFTGPALNDVGQKEKMQMVKDGKVGSMLNVVGLEETCAIQTVAIEQSRLGIPLLFGYDVVHGYKTIFPIPLAEACSWDLGQIEKNASVAAKEASSVGIHWTFAPMCDLSNDPRWGRVMEGIGEDPWYGGLVSASRVRGLQGKLGSDNILACVKHFAAYGAIESGREYNYTDVSRVELWNKYLPPYKAAIEAGAATVMNGFNVFEGIPVSGSKYLVTDVLKEKWGFKGFVVSDWASFGEMVTWGYALDERDAALKAFKAGSAVDMESNVSMKFVPELVKSGKILVDELDDAVGRILYYKFKLGLFDHPYRSNNKAEEGLSVFTQDYRREALEAAKRSIVLLKNDRSILPLKASLQKVSLVGQFANNKEDMFDFWISQGEYKHAISLFEGLQTIWSKDKLLYSKGFNSDGTSSPILTKEAVEKSRTAEVIIVNVGLSGKLAGEDRSLANPVIPEGQIELIKALRQLGKPIVAVVSSGRPLVLTGLEKLVDAILFTWILGTEEGSAIASVLSGTYNPSGKTVMSFPYAVGQIPVYYNQFNTGRPIQTDGQGNWFSRYLDIPRDPLYPFGFGLSYTNFLYADLTITDSVINKNDKLRVSVKLRNVGQYDGEEVVQLYIRDHKAEIVRPVKELKGFQKIFLKRGESKIVAFELCTDSLSYYNASGDAVIEPGTFSVFVGGNSRDVLACTFELRE